LIKKLVSKIKDIFSSKKEEAKPIERTAKSTETKRTYKPRKKETPEEYRLRRSKRAAGNSSRNSDNKTNDPSEKRSRPPRSKDESKESKVSSANNERSGKTERREKPARNPQGRTNEKHINDEKTSSDRKFTRGKRESEESNNKAADAIENKIENDSPESNEKKNQPPRKPRTNQRRKSSQKQNESVNELEVLESEVVPVVPSEPWDESVFKVPAVVGKSRFQDFKLANEILHGVYDLGFQHCTEVQSETLPKSLIGNDIIAQAQTGTGKTAAFLITIFNIILKKPITGKRKHGAPRALILAPTRELVLQIEKDARSIGKYVPCSILSLFGGIDYMKQQKALRSSPIDLLICTPGRLIDFIDKRLVDLSRVEILVIDEADRMLNMGFIPSVKKIVFKTPPKTNRQTMFFSATMSTDVRRLSESWTNEAHEISMKSDNVAVESIEQITYITTVSEKPTLLYNIIMQKNLERVLVFVNRRHEAKKLKETFEMYGIGTTLLSGDVEQAQRIKRLEKFRDGTVRVLVATDVASRGIHVEAISHVINYNLPQDTEEYVHRIGRTGRAGASGISINFADENDSHEIPKIEDFLGKPIECIFPEEELLVPIPEKHRKKVIHRDDHDNVKQQDKKPFKKRTYKKNYRKRDTPNKGNDTSSKE
jgi:ATP-dependent RNA helicase RhlB